MINGLKAIIKKELDKIFLDKKALFSTIFLPGILLFLIYSCIGLTIQSSNNTSYSHEEKIYVLNMDASFYEFYTSHKENLPNIHMELGDNSIEILKNKLSEEEIDGFVQFSDQFTAHSISYLKNEEENLQATVSLYFDTSNKNSSKAYQDFNLILNSYQTSLLEAYDVHYNAFVVSNQNNEVMDQRKTSLQIMGMIFPMLIITFILSSALNITADSIAGEKERGTIATLFMTPVSKKNIILAKVISTTVLTLCSAIVTFLGILLALPFCKNMLGSFDINVKLPFMTVLGLFLMILCVSLLIVAVLLFISSLARSVKEASILSMPVYLLVMIVCGSTMIFDVSGIGFYFIPFYNCIIVMKNLFITNVSGIELIITILSNVCVFGFLIWLLVKVFQQERIMYGK